MKTVEIYTDGEDGFAASMIEIPSGSPLTRQPPDMEGKRRRCSVFRYSHLGNIHENS